MKHPRAIGGGTSCGNGDPKSGPLPGDGSRFLSDLLPRQTRDISSLQPRSLFSE